MLEFYQRMAKFLRQEPVVLATVVRVKGSVPREVGANMVVCSDSRIIGTIGGGAGEAKVIRQALNVLETGEKQFVEIDLSGAPQRETQGVCGGMMHVWLERWQGETALALVNQIIEQLKSGKTGTLITPLELDRSPYLELLTPDTIQPLHPSSLIPHPFTSPSFPRQPYSLWEVDTSRFLWRISLTCRAFGWLFRTIALSSPTINDFQMLP